MDDGQVLSLFREFINAYMDIYGPFTSYRIINGPYCMKKCLPHHDAEQVLKLFTCKNPRIKINRDNLVMTVKFYTTSFYSLDVHDAGSIAYI